MISAVIQQILCALNVAHDGADRIAVERSRKRIARGMNDIVNRKIEIRQIIDIVLHEDQLLRSDIRKPCCHAFCTQVNRIDPDTGICRAVQLQQHVGHKRADQTGCTGDHHRSALQRFGRKHLRNRLLQICAECFAVIKAHILNPSASQSALPSAAP